MKAKERPQLFINTTLLEDKELANQVFLETDKYSITPTTFKARSLNKDLVWYKDEYSHLANKVTRYGINSNTIKTDLEKNTILGEFTDLIDTTKKVEKSVKSSQYKLEDAQKIAHHGLEKYLVQQAISQLLESKDQTILVDIFARDNGAVKILKDTIPETHTVVFYKNPLGIDKKHEILVIDPSNFLFSSHLSNLNGILKHELLSKVTTMHKTLQIYKPVSDYTGPNPDQYRDCIDIAVKIAFGLNKEKEQLNIENIKDYNAIKALSNTSTINDSIPSDIVKEKFVKFPLRIIQKSNVKVGEDFYKFSGKIKETFTKIKNKDELQKQYITTLENSDKMYHIDTISNLYKICENTLNYAIKELEQQKIDTLGDIFNPGHYE